MFDKIFIFISMGMLVFFVLMAFKNLNTDGAYEIGLALIIAIQITRLFVIESEVDKLKKKMKSD